LIGKGVSSYPGVPVGEDLKLSAEMMKTIPPEEIGRMMSGVEAAELIIRQASSSYPHISACQDGI
jgi:hypothetical protein